MPPLPTPHWTYADYARLSTPDDIRAAMAAKGVRVEVGPDGRGKLVRALPAPAARPGGQHEPAPATDRPPVPVPAVPAKPSLLPASVRTAAAKAGKPAGGTTLPHLIVRARAGTGKSTTLIEGVKRVLGLPSPLTPSPQQAAVWDALAGPAGTPRPGSVGFVAFNRSIADELKRRLPAGCDACTMHSLGFAAVRRAFPGVRVEQYRAADFVLEAVGGPGADPKAVRKEHGALVGAVTKLVGLCKTNLTGADLLRDRGRAGDDEGTASAMQTEWETLLDVLASHYDVELEDERTGKDVRAAAFALVPEILARCLDVAADGRVDYDDMVWLPVALDLPVRRYDLLLWDEVQDGNRCQQALARKAGRRLVLCGDDRQAIYQFVGADQAGMDRMYAELGGSCDRCFGGPCDPDCPNRGPGCIVLPLTVTRRCGKAIVDEARKLVPDFEAHPDNGPGTVVRLAGNFPKEGAPPKEQDYRLRARGGDMVLCRTNAPLVSECLRFLRAGVKATIQGRDVGAGIVALVRKLAGRAGDALPVSDLVARLEEYRRREEETENRKRTPNEAKLIALADKVDCLLCLAEGKAAAGDVVRRVEEIFTADPNAPGVRLSSVHRAKGLEAETVYLLEPEKATIPHPMANTPWQVEQEWNLRYVAVTRAVQRLVFVS